MSGVEQAKLMVWGCYRTAALEKTERRQWARSGLSEFLKAVPQIAGADFRAAGAAMAAVPQVADRRASSASGWSLLGLAAGM